MKPEEQKFFNDTISASGDSVEFTDLASIVKPLPPKSKKTIRTALYYKLYPLPKSTELKEGDYIAGNLYIRKQGDDLEYKVRDSDGELVEGKITQKEFQPKIPVEMDRLKLFLPIILKITEKAGHTQESRIGWYELCPLKEDTKPDKSKDPDKFYIRKQDDDLEYKVFDHNGKLQHGKITQEQFQDAILKPLEIDFLKLFLPEILKITTQKQQTQTMLTDDEKAFVVGLELQVNTILAKKMHEEAITRIKIYSSTNSEPDKKDFFTNLADIINKAKDQNNFGIIKTINRLFSKDSQKKDSEKEGRFGFLYGVDDLRPGKPDQKKIDKVFSKPLVSKFSDAAKCLFDIILIYQCFLSSEMAMNIAETYPAFLKFIAQKSVDIDVLGVQLFSPNTLAITNRVKTVFQDELLQLENPLSGIQLERQLGSLEKRIDQAMVDTYWKINPDEKGFSMLSKPKSAPLKPRQGAGEQTKLQSSTRKNQYMAVATGEKTNIEAGFFNNRKCDQLKKQLELVLACEQGDLAAVQKLLNPILGTAALPHLPEASGKQPLAAAVFGMNLDVIKLLLLHMQELGVTPLNWQDCETHNLSRYGRLVILLAPPKDPSNYFGNEINESLFLKNLQSKSKRERGKPFIHNLRDQIKNVITDCRHSGTLKADYCPVKLKCTSKPA